VSHGEKRIRTTRWRLASRAPNASVLPREARKARGKACKIGIAIIAATTARLAG